jgi:uncharacterized protein (TIGR00297 family)
MHREGAARVAVGITAFLLPYLGVFTAIPLAGIFLLDRKTRLLSASFILLLLMRTALEATNLDLPLYVIAISFIAPTFACMASRRFEALPGSIIYLITTIALGYPSAILASHGTLISEKVLFLAVLGGLTGAFLLHVSRERDFAMPFGSCMVMWLFSFDYPLPELGRILIIALIPLALGIAAYWAKAADADAVLSATIVGMLVILFGGPAWFILILSFYILGGAFTKYGYAYKHKLGIAQSKGGARGYKNVYSNSLVPLALAICHGVYGSDLFIFAFVAAVATANGDTLASEIGETSRTKPRMITSFKVVDAGVDGGVTPLGETVSLAGAAIVGILALATGMTGLSGLATAIVGGFLGTNFDSLLGATLQRRGMLSNNGVNLFATLFGALVGALIWTLL